MTNAEVRAAIQTAGVRYWQLADALGIHPATLSVKLRRELKQEEKAKLLQAVERLKRETED